MSYKLLLLIIIITIIIIMVVNIFIISIIIFVIHLLIFIFVIITFITRITVIILINNYHMFTNSILLESSELYISFLFHTASQFILHHSFFKFVGLICRRVKSNGLILSSWFLSFVFWYWFILERLLWKSFWIYLLGFSFCNFLIFLLFC